jgi:hypothetical protein
MKNGEKSGETGCVSSKCWHIGGGGVTIFGPIYRPLIDPA